VISASSSSSPALTAMIGSPTDDPAVPDDGNGRLKRPAEVLNRSSGVSGLACTS
jgi:hypothetical protein